MIIDNDMDEKKSFQEAIDVTNRIIERFEKIEERKWGAQGTLIELQKQVGELAKLVMVHEKYYFSNRDKEDTQYKSDKEKIADELADIFYAVIRMAKHYDIDLEKAHFDTRKIEDEFLKSKGV